MVSIAPSSPSSGEGTLLAFWLPIQGVETASRLTQKRAASAREKERGKASEAATYGEERKLTLEAAIMMEDGIRFSYPLLKEGDMKIRQEGSLGKEEMRNIIAQMKRIMGKKAKEDRGGNLLTELKGRIPVLIDDQPHFKWRFAKFCGIVTAESFAASAMGLTVGAMVPTSEAAMALGPSLMTVFIVFGGYYVNAENTPLIFRWIPSVSLIRWAFQGICINEFRGLQFDHQHSFDIQTGEQALERLSFGGSRIRDTVVAQGRILLFWYWTTYLLLEKNKPKYQQLLPPPEPFGKTKDA
ncbi:hypothetical protein Taro_035758 [Colocasia esculenta]|uniref:ABC-2 type transporter transmembrane domain-containing protein n=1 Tax=Colocasia esculenta TaxID=4460 RepID=A0A843WFS1_COLES|nr:hypothetical protein [Colocasia esculenta]